MSVVVTDVEQTQGFWDIERERRAAFREVGRDDVKLTLRMRPFLQVVGLIPKEIVKESGDPFDRSDFVEPWVIQVDNGWAIQYWPVSEKYPPAMATSPGVNLWGGFDQEGFLPSQVKGTMVNQAFHVAMHVVMAAKQRQWQALQMIDGTRLMQWAAWAMATHLELPVYGFEATAHDQAKLERVAFVLERYQKQLADENVLTDSLAFTPAPGGQLDSLLSATEVGFLVDGLDDADA